MCYDFPIAKTAQFQCSINIEKCTTHKIKKLGITKMGKMRTSVEVLYAWKLKAFSEC
jgi:hypothetical protein